MSKNIYNAYPKAERLLQRDNQFTNFMHISEDDYHRIDAEAEKFKLFLLDNNKYNSFMSPKAVQLDQVLDYLLAPNVHFRLKSYDERILFMILVLDPDLDAFYSYIDTDYPKKPVSLPYVEDYRTDKEKQDDMDQYRLDYENVKNDMIFKIRSIIGTYDNRIIKYEESYFNTYVSPFYLAKSSKIDFSSMLAFYFSKPTDFSSIDQNRFEEINAIAKDYLSVMEEVDVSTTLFHIFKQRKLLQLNTRSELLLFFILVLDPNLSILKEYNECGNWGQLYQYMYTEFGFISNQVHITEDNYRKKFAPDIKLPFDSFGK